MKIRQSIRRIISRLGANALLVLLFASFANPLSARADNLPTLEEFVAQVANGDGETLRGVYIPLKLALPVVQQPPGQNDFISPMSAALTEFRMAQKAGSIGLLAHNYLAGKHFFLIERGDLVFLAYGNRRVETFVVQEIRKYEELYGGMYKDLETLENFSAREVFQRMYGAPRRLTLQTCIEKDGNWNWGRLFILAVPQGTESVSTEAGFAPPPPPPPPAFSKQVLGWPLAPRAEQSPKPVFRSKAPAPK